MSEGVGRRVGGDGPKGRAAASCDDDAVADPDAAGAVDVVAGVVLDAGGGRVLLARRRPEQHRGDRWEFPGGKIEPGESIDAALARELVEEIGIVPRTMRHRLSLEHDYPDKRVRLHFVDVTAFDGQPDGREGQALAWVALGEIGELEFPEANRAVVDMLLAEAAERAPQGAAFDRSRASSA